MHAEVLLYQMISARISNKQKISNSNIKILFTFYCFTDRQTTLRKNV